MNYNETNPTTATLSHESLDVYRLSLKFHLGVMDLLPKRGSPTLRDQLERASTSIILNIAEGAGRRTTPDRRRYFIIAQGSTYECSAILDILRLRRIAQPSRCLTARNYAVRIAQMLGKLAR
jgi:four helix bundle protein